MPCLRKAYPQDGARAETGVLTMGECIEREATIKRIEEVYCADCNSYNGVRCRACGTGDAIDMIEDAPAADVAPIEALEHLRDELCAQDLITMEGLRRLNTLIWKYTTVYDGG